MELLTNVAVRPDRAVVVVTHDQRVFRFADRIAHMDDGRIVETRVETRAQADFRGGELMIKYGLPDFCGAGVDVRGFEDYFIAAGACPN